MEDQSNWASAPPSSASLVWYGDILNRIEQVLTQESTEEYSVALVHDPQALQAMEKSFYDTLSQKHYSNSSVPPMASAVHHQICDGELVSQFRRGEEEARKFLPQNLLSSIDFRNIGCEVVGADGGGSNIVDMDEDEDEDELSELFDRLFLGNDDNGGARFPLKPIDALIPAISSPSSSSPLIIIPDMMESSKPAATMKEIRNIGGAVNLECHLLDCARAAASDNRDAAHGLLRKIRQHSSPFGGASQRVAHYFANGIDARLAGVGARLYFCSEPNVWPSSIDSLRILEPFDASCPFKKIGFRFAFHQILKLAETATVLHIIDFGIMHGFSWAVVIHRLSTRPAGPPLLRITGIEHVEPGYPCPDRVVKETGRRLAKYCQHLNVPFEFNGISQSWETIRVEDLDVRENETVAVICMLRLESMMDEFVVGGSCSPRDSVLRLIRKINPHIFLHSLLNAAFNTPSFVPRFREALYFISAFFDMFEANYARENGERLVAERCYFGRDVLNVVACEGRERVVRTETYKRWQVRTARAGFRQLPLNRELVAALRAEVKAGHHRNFMIEQDGHWILQGWKGRPLVASCCWVPTPQQL